MQCAGSARRRWVADSQEEVAEKGKQLSPKAGQRRSSLDKTLLREEVAERSGTASKRWVDSFIDPLILSCCH